MKGWWDGEGSIRWKMGVLGVRGLIRGARAGERVREGTSECPAASWKPASNGWWDDREGRGKGGWGRVIMEGGIRWKIGVLGRSKGIDKEGGGGAGKEHL